MRTFILMRHGDAPNFSASGEFIDDFDRSLSEKGKIETKAAAKKLSSKYNIDLIVSSNAPRSYTTAKFLLDEFPDCFFRQEEILYNGTSQLIQRFLWSIEDDFKVICIIGHNPTITEIIREMSNGEHSETLKPSEFVVIKDE
ncbi:MAG: histidine phosphatase family protein [Rickettsiaceae bacterium]|nr:histidine phosphatase family protein [Rickettsiaceae bacterium]